MPRHPFLSPEWIAAARAIRDEFLTEVPPIQTRIAANVIITEAPFGDGAIHGHVDTSTGALLLDDGHLDDADLTVEIRYELARSLFVERDIQAAMQALFGGQIKVTGDSSKLLAIQPPPTEADATPEARELVRRIEAITADPPA